MAERLGKWIGELYVDCWLHASEVEREALTSVLMLWACLIGVTIAALIFDDCPICGGGRGT